MELAVVRATLAVRLRVPGYHIPPAHMMDHLGFPSCSGDGGVVPQISAGISTLDICVGGSDVSANVPVLIGTLQQDFFVKLVAATERTSSMVVLFEYQVSFSGVKTLVLTFTDCTWQWHYAPLLKALPEAYSDFLFWIAAMFKIGNSKELPPIPDHLSEEGKDFIRQCLQRDPSSRPTAVDLLQHSFVRSASPLERPAASVPLEQLAAISCKPSSKVVGQAKNMPSLGLEGQSIYQRRAAKFSSTNSGIHIWSNTSCPVSPCGSPLLRSRSPQHQNGRMSPSPISSPRATSGASSPVGGVHGAIPFSHARQPAYSNEGFTIAPRGLDKNLPTRPPDPVLGHFGRAQQFSTGTQERVISECDILRPQTGKMRRLNVQDLNATTLPSKHVSQHGSGSHVRLKPSLDLTSGNQRLVRNHGH
ncbi:unnamed protein product [Triticum turgidum subsp. durum]|uniref:Uncharacterized protein n=1 Tax=Triticum turgidum subsp. durum TaxID=4567 RepID=A0A9R1B175_TRITD|nr:unnamed protein product [Triticum turgidum subsp. durum]